MGLFGRKKATNDPGKFARELFGANSGKNDTWYVFYGKIEGRPHGRDDAALMSFPPAKLFPDQCRDKKIVRFAFDEWTKNEYDFSVLIALRRVGYTDVLDDEYETEEGKKDRIRLCQEIEKAIKNKNGATLSKKTGFYVRERFGMNEDLFAIAFVV